LVAVAVYQPRPDQPLEIDAVRHHARERMHIDYPCAIDGAGGLERRFDNPFAPGYFVFDRDRRLRHRQMGNARLDAVEALLERLLVKASPAGEAY
jgi:hypothetical protein